MPTLSLTLAQSGPPPEGEPARANSGTEGREGNLAVNTNDSETENTWTRVFQSYTQPNKQAAIASVKPTAKGASEQAKSANDALPAKNAAVTAPAVVSPQLPLTATQLLTAVNAGNLAISEPKQSDLHVDSSAPMVGIRHSASILTCPQPKPVLTSKTDSNSTFSGASTHLPSNSITALPQSSSKTRSSQSTTSVDTAPVMSGIAALPVETGAANPAVLTSAAPTTSRTEKQLSATPISQRAISSSAQMTQPTVSAQVPVADASTQQSSGSAVTTPSLPQMTLTQGLSSEVITALQNAKVSSTQTGPVANASKSTVGLATRAGMERNQVLGDTSAMTHSPITSKDGSSNDDSFDTKDSSGTDKLAAAETTQSPGSGSFSGVLSDVNASNSSAAGLTNAALVQSSSHDERMAVVNQISAHIQSMQLATSDPNTMTVTVQPPHWGEVKIVVALSPETAGVSGSNITATVTSATNEVSGVLQQHAQDLKDSLSSIGLHLDKLNTGVATVAALSQSGSSTGHHAGQQSNSSGGQDLQSAWSGHSAGSGGNSFQSSTGWSGQNDDAVSDGTNLTETTMVAGVMPVPTNGGTTTTRIDMRA
jgi:hypothetical protein